MQKWFLVERMQIRSLELASVETDDRREGRRGRFYSWGIKKSDKGWRIEREGRKEGGSRGERERERDGGGNWATANKGRNLGRRSEYFEENLQ